MRFLLAWLTLPLAADPGLILHNGKLWTGDPAQPWAQAIAFENGKISLVGSNEAVLKLRGPATQVIDLEGKLAGPGFNDAHIHFRGGSMGLSQVDLVGACSIPEMQKRVAAWAAANPSEKWITGAGWEYSCVPGGLPRKEDLDAVVADRPVFLSAYDGHSGWVNSAALRAAGIGPETRAPGFGEIVRDASGEATGALKEGAQSLVRRHIPPATKDKRRAALLAGMKLAASLGITSIQNASGSPAELEEYEELRKQDLLTLRVAMAMSVPPGTRFTELAKYRALKARYRGPDLKTGAIKIILDGVIESRTAAMLEPYEGSNESGTPAWSEPFYREMVEKADASGLQVYTHAIGDRAVRMALDAYERARRINGNKDARWRIEHIETISPDDIPRFARIGVLASMQPIHADPGSSAVWSRQIGPARLPWSFAWKSLLEAGARLVFSSDWPACIDVNPIRGLHVAVNRQTPEGKPEGGWVPRQKVTLEQALRAYTAGGAYASFEEDTKGMLKAGMLGDAVVFQQDLFAIPPSRIHEVKVAMTIVNGKVVYR